MDVCVQCSHWTHTIKLFLVGLPEGRRTKSLEYNRPWYRGGDLRDVPLTRVQKNFARQGATSRKEGATERACRSPNLFREDIAKSSTVFKVRRRSDTSSMGSNGGMQRASSTTARSQGGTRDRTLGLSLITPWRKRVIRGSLPPGCPGVTEEPGQHPRTS